MAALSKSEVLDILNASMPDSELLYVVNSDVPDKLVFNWRSGRYSIDCTNFEVTVLGDKNQFAKDCCILIKRILLYELTS